MNKIILTLSCLLLTSCIGSYVVFQDDDPKPFKTLHSVPERHKFTPHEIHTKEELKLKDEHQKSLLEGQKVRKNAQLLENQPPQAVLLKEK